MRIKRERATSISPILRPLKTSKGARGQVIFHLDSDDEEEMMQSSQEKSIDASAPNVGEDAKHADIEVITLA
jgi:hypothetical protein